MLDLKSYFHDKYQGGESFVENVILPIFGDDKYEDAYEEEVLENNPELTKMATSVGISQILRMGTINIPMNPTDVFDITVSNHVQMERNRVSIQLLIRRIMSTYSSAFMVFHYEDDTRWDWRFTFCSKQGSNQESTDSKRYTFLLGPNQSCRTAAENFRKLAEKQGEIELDDIVKAFDVESLSKEFFEKYKAQYEKFCNYIYNNRYDETKFGSFFASCEDKIIRDYVKKLLGRLVFLQFLQKKGWLGASSCEWNDGDRDFLQHLFENASKEQKDDFLDTVLEPMFEKALDGNRAATNYDYDTGVKGFRNVKIPYLNGGLYSKDAGIDDAKSVFPATYFEELFTFFYQYNFTIDENDPNDAEVGIDPEMLGRIFENLLEDNKDKGAFYTPKPIVQYMCKESLIAYLQNGCSTDCAKKVARTFVETHDAAPLRELHMEANGKKTNGSVLEFFDKMLKNVKICDPAIGSGAFPMGLLRELYACRSAIEDFETTTPAEIKKEIIQNNIYGVDIEKGAVDIARLRFWLSLILDEEDPKALPNLDFKIMQGNSLLESFHGVDLSNVAVGKQNATKGLKSAAKHLQQNLFFFDEAQAQKDIQDSIRRYFATDNHSVKQLLLAKIENSVRLYLSHLTEGQPALQEEIKELPLCNDQFFLWHTFFADVFANGGFDIVIGNPPYIQLQADNGILGDIYKNAGFETYARTGDIYCLFYEHGYRLLKEHGHLCYITSNKWMRAGYGEKTRGFLANNTNPKLLVDFAGVKIFESATVDTNILLFSREENAKQTVCVVTNKENKDCIKKLSGFVQQHHTVDAFVSSDNWVILSEIEQSIKHKIERVGTPLKDWDIQINYGLKTGYNDAFIIKSDVRERILANCQTEDERKRTAEIIRPILRGRDIKKYGYDWADLWLIWVPWHFPLHFDESIQGASEIAEDTFRREYPSVYAHLSLYKKQLSARNKAETGIRYEWYALQRWGAKYWDDFSKPKIVYPETTQGAYFAFDDKGLFIDKTCFMLISDEAQYLQHTLSSRLFEFAYKNIFSSIELGEHGYQYNKHALVKLPVLKCSDSSILNDVQDIDEKIYTLYDISEDEIRFIESR